MVASAEGALAKAVGEAIRLRVSTPLEYIAHHLQHRSGDASDEISYARQHGLQGHLQVALEHAELQGGEATTDVLGSMARALLTSSHHQRHAAAEVAISALRDELRTEEVGIQSAAEQAQRLQRSEAQTRQLKTRHAKLVKMCRDNCPDLLRAFYQGAMVIGSDGTADFTVRPTSAESSGVAVQQLVTQWCSCCWQQRGMSE